MSQTVDITPDPRILRTLGQIPFQSWQCLAELIDNALDAFQAAEENSIPLSEKKVVISWSNESVQPNLRKLELVDTGPGMTLETLRNCVKAGYSSNDPVHHLGLFGMGFNIATAKLGDKTLVLSAQKQSPHWAGVEINFESMIQEKSYGVPVISEPKAKPDLHGTKIVVSNLNDGIYRQLLHDKTQIIKTLSDVYSPILSNTDVTIIVQGTALTPRNHCVWAGERYVSRKGVTIPARIEFDHIIADVLFDISRNKYLSPDESDQARAYEATNAALQPGIIERTKRIRGWLGIQRYADPNDFGIDFIRNGRKILLRDKSLFTYINSINASPELEYPVELGTTSGGRIVGEVHVDHLTPTYQKNDFDRTDSSWDQMRLYLRGDGPMLPRRRQDLGFDLPNDSHLSLLVNAYRRLDPGTKNLAIPNKLARQWSAKFRQGDPEYQSDDKWWKTAQEQDRDNADKGAAVAPVVDSGDEPTDDLDQYGPDDSYVPPSSNPSKQPKAPPAAVSSKSSAASAVLKPAQPAKMPNQPDTPEDLKARSVKQETYSREYSYKGCHNPITVRVWELTLSEFENNSPCIVHRDGNEIDFFYNPRHSLLQNYPVGFTDLLLMSLAERFKLRDNLKLDIPTIFALLTEANFQDTRIDLPRIQELATAFFGRLRDSAVTLLANRELEVLECIHESAGDVEEITAALIFNSGLLQRFQAASIGGIEAVSVVPARTLIRLVDRFPEQFFDQHYFDLPYSGIKLTDPNATERLRNISKDRIISFMKDAMWVISENHSVRSKSELARCAHSLTFLAKASTL